MRRLLETAERPSARDARWLILVALAGYDIYGLTTPFFSRTWIQWVAAVGSCMSTELIVALVSGRPLRWLSGLISGLGLFLLCDSALVWPYVLLGVIAVSSKSLIRDERGSIFNPTNFALAVGLAWLPTSVGTDATRWMAPLSGAVAVAICGLVISWRAGRLGVALAYQCTFIAAAFVRAYVTQGKPLILMAPMTGLAFQLFSFYMVTDPATSPRNLRAGLLFGAAVGALDGYLRHLTFHTAPIFALLAVTALRPLFGEFAYAGAPAPAPAPSQPAQLGQAA